MKSATAKVASSNCLPLNKKVMLKKHKQENKKMNVFGIKYHQNIMPQKKIHKFICMQQVGRQQQWQNT